MGTVGITEYAQHELGDIVHIDLPEVGASFNKRDVIVRIGLGLIFNKYFSAELRV